MTYSINKYFSEEECSEIIKYCMENGTPFKYNSSEHWDCRKIYVETFKENIISKFNILYEQNKTKYWFDYSNFDVKNISISLTRYYEDRFLNLHRDAISQFTTVIVLTNNFEDGRFVLSETEGKDIYDMKDDSIKLNLNIGEGISFDGSKVYHGVMPVNKGMRCALNVWMSNENFKSSKTLI